MILWGLTSAAMACVQDVWSFYALRFLLGIFEAGFGPGIVFYLTGWYSRRSMARVLAVILLAGPAGGVLGGPLSTGIMSTLNGAAGLSGWQWLFLAEGLPCVILGVLTPFVLADSPRQARWLDDRERDLLEADIAAGSSSETWANVLRSPRIYLLSLGYFCLISTIYGFSFWLPTLLQEMGIDRLNMIGLYSAIPYALAIVFMLLAAASSDRLGDRRWHSAGLAGLAAITLAVATTLPGTGMAWFAAITLTMALVWAAYSVFWAIPGEMLGSGRAAAGGIALINSIGLIGGFITPAMLGWIKQRTGSFDDGLLFITGLLCLASVTIAIVAPSSSRKAGAR
jgi:MFS family permease